MFELPTRNYDHPRLALCYKNFSIFAHFNKFNAEVSVYMSSIHQNDVLYICADICDSNQLACIYHTNNYFLLLQCSVHRCYWMS